MLLSYMTAKRSVVMIPDLPNTCTDLDRIVFYDTLLGNLQEQSTIHVRWHTHRQNPSTCWICDMITLTSKVMLLTNKYITKSTLDTVTGLSSEEDSDTEIEIDLNHDEEPVPEYETIPEEEQVGGSE